MTKKRTMRAGSILALLLACLISALPPRMARAAGTGEVTLTVRQVFTHDGSSAPPSETFSYKLTPKRAENPMPVGHGSGSYDFTITGTRTAQIGPIRFTSAGAYAYEISGVAGSQPGYLYDQKVYTVEVLVESDLTATVLVYVEDGSKAENIEYTHSYSFDRGLLPSDPKLMVDPPVVKTVSGTPPTASVFTFRLTAGNPANPMPAGSVNGVKTVQVRGSGSTEFGTWPYTAEGIYYYTISEVNAGGSDYAYDATVYTITDTVRAQDGKLVLTRVVTNSANRAVTSCSFINTYTGAASGGDPGNPGNPGTPGKGPGIGPKTGDESQATLYTVLLCAAGAAALGSAGYLLAGRRRGKATKR